MSYKQERIIPEKVFVVFLLQCNFVFTFLMPDKYLGIADYWYFIFPTSLLMITYFCKSGIVFTRASKFLAFFLLYQIIPLFVSVFIVGDTNSGYFLSYVLYIGFFILLLLYPFTEKDYKKILNAYILSGAIIGALIAYQKVDYYDGSGYRYTIQILGHEKFDPNFLGAYLVFPFIILLAKLFRKFSYLNIIYFFLISIGVLYTASRTSMVGCFLGLLFVLRDLMKRKKVKRKSTILFVVISCVVILYIVLLVLPEGTFNRLFVYSYMDASNEKRLDDWEYGIKAFQLRPLLGYGFLGEMDIINMATRTQMIAHNTYIGLILQYGVIGCKIMIIGLICLWKKIWDIKEQLLLGVYITTLIVVLMVSAEVAVFLWFPIILTTGITEIIRRNRKLSLDAFL